MAFITFGFFGVVLPKNMPSDIKPEPFMPTGNPDAIAMTSSGSGNANSSFIALTILNRKNHRCGSSFPQFVLVWLHQLFLFLTGYVSFSNNAINTGRILRLILEERNRMIE